MLAFISIISLLSSSVVSFQVHQAVSSRGCSLSMAAVDKGLTKRGMFRQLREKLNKAAEIPGFFDVGEGTPVNFATTIFPIVF